MISHHTAQKKKKTDKATTTAYFGFLFEGNSGREISLFEELCFQSFFVHTKTLASAFNCFLQFEERFSKAPFL